MSRRSRKLVRRARRAASAARVWVSDEEIADLMGGALHDLAWSSCFGPDTPRAASVLLAETWMREAIVAAFGPAILVGTAETALGRNELRERAHVALESALAGYFQHFEEEEDGPFR